MSAALLYNNSLGYENYENQTKIPIQTIPLAFILALRHARSDRGLVNIKGLKCPHVSKFVKSNTSEDIDSVTLLPIIKTQFEFYSYTIK